MYALIPNFSNPQQSITQEPTVCFTNLDKGNEIISKFSLPKSMKHTVEFTDHPSPKFKIQIILKNDLCTRSLRYTPLRYSSFQFHVIIKLLLQFQYMSLKMTYIEKLVTDIKLFHIYITFHCFTIYTSCQLKLIATDIED
jgi:hypothetical protein